MYVLLVLYVRTVQQKYNEPAEPISEICSTDCNFSNFEVSLVSMDPDTIDRIYQKVLEPFRVQCTKREEQVRNLIEEYYSRVDKMDKKQYELIVKTIRKAYPKEEWVEVKYMLKSIFIFIRDEHRSHLHKEHISDILADYPEFTETEPQEKALLLRFRNLFIVACELIDPKNHKGELIQLIGRMCGTVYVLGGGQSPATDRRVLIFERETGIRTRQAFSRKRDLTDPATLSLAVLHTGMAKKQSFHRTALTLNGAEVESFSPPQSRTVNDVEQTLQLLRAADSFYIYHRSLLDNEAAAVAAAGQHSGASGYHNTYQPLPSMRAPVQHLQHLQHTQHMHYIEPAPTVCSFPSAMSDYSSGMATSRYQPDHPTSRTQPYPHAQVQPWNMNVVYPPQPLPQQQAQCSRSQEDPCTTSAAASTSTSESTTMPTHCVGAAAAVVPVGTSGCVSLPATATVAASTTTPATTAAPIDTVIHTGTGTVTTTGTGLKPSVLSNALDFHVSVVVVETRPLR